MRKYIVIASTLAGTLFSVLPATAGTIFVAPTGSNGATCGTPAAPCQTLQKGHDRVDPGGTVLLTEPGNYGSATINKSVNIRGVPAAGIFSPPSAPCLIVNGGPNDVVTLDNVACDMDGAARDGILFNSGHKLRVANSVIRGAGTSNCGIRFKPATGSSELMVDNVTLTENGISGNNIGGGICLLPSGPAHVTGVLRNVVLQNDRHGLVSAPSGAATSKMLLDGVDASANAGGLFSVGANSTLCVRNSTISGNSFMGIGGNGMTLNGGGNTVWNNTTNGGFTGTCP